MDIHYRANEGEVATAAANFFSPKRRKTAGLETTVGTKTLQQQIGEPSNAMPYSTTEGTPTYHNHSSQKKQTSHTKDDDDIMQQIQLSGSIASVQSNRQSLNPHKTAAPSTHTNSSSKHNRKQKQQPGEVNSAYVETHGSKVLTPTVIEPILPAVTEDQDIDSHNHANVATDGCNQPQPQKSKKDEDQIPNRRTQMHHSDSNICTIGEPSNSNMPQNLRMRHDDQPNIAHAPGCQRQRRKRNQPRNQTSTRRVRRRVPVPDLHGHLDDGLNSIDERSSSYAPQCNNQPNIAHGAARQQQPRKRNQPRNQPSTRRVRRRHLPPDLHGHSADGFSNGEGSCSYATQDASPAYDDLGNCIEQCNYCGASFWRGERLKGHTSTSGMPQYHLCCGGGKVYMEPDPEPPEYIKHLLGHAHFMENIRAYNQMFAMTSFGATIDSTVNQGRGPYVFKVSGQIYHRIGSLCPTGDDDPKFLQLYIYDTKNEVRNRLAAFSNSDTTTLDPEIVQGLIHFLDAHNELVQIFRTARDKCAQIQSQSSKLQTASQQP